MEVIKLHEKLDQIRNQQLTEILKRQEEHIQLFTGVIEALQASAGQTLFGISSSTPALSDRQCVYSVIKAMQSYGQRGRHSQF